MLSNPSGRSRPSLSLLRGMVYLSVLAYIPLSVTYFMTSDVTKERLQDFVLAYLVSHEFAFGAGSGFDGHWDTFARTHASMLFHSLAGSIALLLGLSQFSDGFRKAYPTAHRRFGYVYLVCGCALVPLSAANYLLRTDPRDVISGPAFAFLLWLTAAGTALTGFLALQAARQRRIERHRDWMALNFALMFSAPLLRYGWIILGISWAETKEFINLIVGILSPGFLLSSAVFYIRRLKGRPQLPRKPISTTTIVGVLASFVIGIASLAAQISDTQWWRPVPLFWSSVPPLVVQHIAFLVLAIRATDDNSRIYWHTFVLGLFTIPLWASLSFETCRLLLHSDSGSAWYAAAIGGSALSTYGSFLVNVYSTSYSADDRRYTTDSVKPKALM